MKKRLFGVACALAMVLAIPASAFAEEAYALPGPGMTPAGRLYFAETWMQHMGVTFTFGKQAKVQKALRYAGEKLAEMEAVAQQGQTRYMERAALEYRYFLNVATRSMKRNMLGGNETLSRVVMLMSEHISVINNNQNRGNEDCQQIRLQTREQAQVCQETAVRVVAGQNPEEAVRLNLALMEQECIRMNNCTGQGDGGQGGEALQQYERLRLMNEEFVACAVQMGHGPEAQQMVDAAMAYQSGVLAQVRNQLQTGDEGATGSLSQNRVQEQEQYSLESGDIQRPSPTPATEQSRNGTGYTYGPDGTSGQKR